MTMHMKPRLRGMVAVRADAGGDIKTTLAALTKTFEEFKAANDERLAAKADVVVDEKVDRINASVTELQTKMEEATKAASDAQSRMDELEKLEARLKAGGSDMKPEEIRAETVAFLAGKKGVEDIEVDEAKIEAYKEYSDTFAKFLKVGDRDHAIQASMSVGSDPDGGYWVPTQMSNDIKRRIFETSPMRQLASVVTITTDSIEYPTDTNDATSGGWVGETASRAATATPQVGQQKIYVREQYAMPQVTQKLLDMATIDVASWLNGKIADKMARTENTAFVSGAGVDQPRGFLDYKSAAVTTDDASRSWGVLQYVATGASAAFPTVSGVPSASDPDTLITLISKLNPAYRAGANWVMNRATEAVVRKMKDGDGRYIVGMGDLRDSATGFNLLGYNIVTAEDMPDVAANSYSIAFGNFGIGYQIVDGRGLRILRDPYTNKPYVRFYTTKWTGGDVVNFDAIKLLKFGTS